MHWDPTITLGTLLTIVALVTTAVGSVWGFRIWLSVKFTEMQSTLNNHATQLESTAEELKSQRAAHTALIGQVQHLVGQMELMIRMQDPRRTTRGGG